MGASRSNTCLELLNYFDVTCLFFGALVLISNLRMRQPQQHALHAALVAALVSHALCASPFCQPTPPTLHTRSRHGVRRAPATCHCPRHRPTHGHGCRSNHEARRVRPLLLNQVAAGRAQRASATDQTTRCGRPETLPEQTLSRLSDGALDVQNIESARVAGAPARYLAHDGSVVTVARPLLQPVRPRCH